MSALAIDQRRPKPHKRARAGARRTTPKAGLMDRGRAAFRAALKRLHAIARIIVLVLSVAGGIAAVTAIVTALAYPVQEVVLYGDFTAEERSQVQVQLGELVEVPYLLLNLGSVQAALQAPSWVDSVSVQRRMPDALVVRVVRQVPLARWNENQYISRTGQVFESESAENTTRLPRLYGPESGAGEAVERLQQLRQVVAPMGFGVLALSNQRSEGWRAQLSDGSSIAFGAGDKFAERLRTLEHLLVHLAGTEQSGATAIDLRYDSAAAVRSLNAVSTPFAVGRYSADERASQRWGR